MTGVIYFLKTSFKIKQKNIQESLFQELVKARTFGETLFEHSVQRFPRIIFLTICCIPEHFHARFFAEIVETEKFINYFSENWWTNDV